ncbi:ATP-dependent nuclease [Dichotomicrobium thermohalophilum]|uniref:Putative AbiEii toxin of type IV toxin-antitoxin system n=1 Tax=Dichotomicrobium thermohalophilum TaxID=933063 RepID=A0A397QCC2_9HYPH|nr:AAA family ATPase [Dichotomicrobium thermohalophilum]RIA55901.1 putative AbiEii toxin of type IV toxin-antitoxin system [Dichotomicrobium thermohalophilum]
MPRSEIRDSVVNQLLEKAANQNYKQYLPKMELVKIRGFESEPVSFDFPVTALIGPNGGGKTTILGAAGCAYKSVSPRRFFAKSGIYDESMQDWEIQYDIIDREINPKGVFGRTANFRNLRWNRDAPDRPVLIFGVSRTVPANEKSELAKCARGSFSVPKERVLDFPGEVSSQVSRILGKDVSSFQRLLIDDDGKVVLLTGKTEDGHQYSEFHFGAGESSIMRMIAEIESAEDNSLILIEEIENGLHPVATQRMVEYLIDVAERKKTQTIFTTHSDDALRSLPDKAIWVAQNNRAFQGKLEVGSLRAITGQVEARLVIFVEDNFAKIWVESMLRELENFDMGEVETHAMEGDGMAVSINHYHNKNPSVRMPSICFVDGDSQYGEDPENHVYKLPGEMPESYVFDEVMSMENVIGGKLSVALLQGYEDHDKVMRLCRDIRRDNRDAHLLYAQLGEKLGFVPEVTVAHAFCSIWAQSNVDTVRTILEPVVHVMSTTG